MSRSSGQGFDHSKYLKGCSLSSKVNGCREYRIKVAQLAERPLKGQCNSADMGSNADCGIRRLVKILAAPSVK